MRSCFLLLYYLLTWLRPLVWLVRAGLALLCIAALSALLGQTQFAFGLSIYAYIALLVIPYALAWHPLRVMLASRRLAVLPGFRTRLGLALLVFTLLLAIFLPLASMMLWPGIVPFHVTLGIFFAASLFTLAMQWAVASPYSVLIYSLGPMFLMYVAAKSWPLLVVIFTREANFIPLVLAAAFGWSLVLRTIGSRRDFRPPGKAPIHARDFVWEGRSDWLGVLFGNYKGPVKSAAGTLLMGTPDGFSGRFFSMLYLVFVSPMIGMTALYLAGFAPASQGISGLTAMFLGFSLMACTMSGLGNGELGARSRLVWLRQHGGRVAHWRNIERRLVTDTLLLSLIVVPITGVALLMFDTLAFDPLTYCLMALACNVLGNYFSLAARLSHWSWLLQWLMIMAMAVGLIVGRILEILPLPILIALVLGLALLFRQQACQRFAVVDWYRLRPASPTLKEKMS